MTDDLRQRIEAVLREHWICDCGEWAENLDEQFAHVAERIASVLQPDITGEQLIEYLKSRNLSICNYSRNGAGFWPVNDELAVARAAVDEMGRRGE